VKFIRVQTGLSDNGTVVVVNPDDSRVRKAGPGTAAETAEQFLILRLGYDGGPAAGRWPGFHRPRGLLLLRACLRPQVVAGWATLRWRARRRVMTMIMAQ
jgi:hypothetical protein